MGSNTPWFRLWDEIADDPKLLRLSEKHRWVWICIMCLANRSPIRGQLYVAENTPADLGDIVNISRQPPKLVEEAVRIFAEYGMLVQDEQGAWVVKNWEKRQPDSKNAERQRRFRERQKAALRNALRNASDNVSGNALELDTDKEEEAEREADDMRELPDHLRDDWMKAFEFWYLDAPPPTYIQRFARFQYEGGLTDRLIVAVLEKGRQLKKRNVCAWAAPILAELASYGIRTVEEWEQFEKERSVKSASRRSKPSSVVPEDEVTRQLREMLSRGNQIQ